MTQPEPEKLAVGPNEGARMLGIGRDAMFRLLLSGQLPSFRIGARRLIAVSDLRAFVDARAGSA
jgi:excisionase family DNA binding protein